MASVHADISYTAPDSSAEKPAAVDISTIYESKENIQPIAKGRSASTLSNIFGSDKSARKAELNAAHANFEAEIAATADDEDPFKAYSNYIKWAIEAYPSGDSHESNLVPLLERATRTFKDDERYSRDVRYLRCWILYAKYVHEPLDIFRFLLANDIGTVWALLYEEAAAAEEGKGRRDKADDLYRLGIARKAQPLERLKTRYKDFQARMITSLPAPPSSSASSSSANVRTVLGGASGALQGTSAAKPRNNGAKMSIFVEDGAPGNGSGSWEDVGTREDRRKENVVEKTPWKGETLKQGRAVTPKADKIEIFREDDAPLITPSRASDDLFGRSVKLSEAELLRQNPFKNYDAPPNLEVPAPPPRAPAPSSSAPHKRPSSKSKATFASAGEPRVAVDLHRVYADGKEWSFEELRAKRMGLYGRQWPAFDPSERAWVSMNPEAERPNPKKPGAASPTVNTKAALEDVMELFNQPLACDRDSDSDSDSDSDDEPRMMVPAAASLIPPTPTPAQGSIRSRGGTPPMAIFTDEHTSRLEALCGGNAAAPPPAVFQDENAIPPTPRSDAAAAQPFRTPLGARKPMFEVFSEPRPAAIAEEDEHPSRPSPVREEVEPEPESEPAHAAESEEQAASEAATGQLIDFEPSFAPEPEQEEGADDFGYQQPPYRQSRFPPITLMTPITERTCEFTTRIDSADMAFVEPRTTVGEDEDEDEPQRTVLALSLRASASGPLGPVPEEGSSSVEPSFAQEPSQPTPHLDLTKGYTIDGNTGKIASALSAGELILVHCTATLHLGQPGSSSPQTSPARPQPTAIPSSTSSSAFAPPNPCNPQDADIISAILARSSTPLESLPGFVDLRAHEANKLEGLQKAARLKARKSSGSQRSSRVGVADDDAPWILELEQERYEVKNKIGEGGFGAVFLTRDLRAAATREPEFDEDGFEIEPDEDVPLTEPILAVKAERPANLWEFHVLHQHARLPERVRSSFIRPRGLYAFADESFLLLDYSDQGTLLDVVNHAPEWFSSAGKPAQAMDEVLVFFFTIELLRAVEGLHDAGIIHGDLKIDNCLVRLEEVPGDSAAWSNDYDRTGANGWAAKGVRIIDFGRAIDLSAFPEGQTFIADWETDARDCAEMREARPWTYQTDYFGLAGIVHCMLFGKYIETVVAAPSPTPSPSAPAPSLSASTDGGAPPKRYKLAQALKRYWQVDLWSRLFDALLNPRLAPPDAALPITDELRAIRTEMEDWLEQNCHSKGRNLRFSVKMMERRCRELVAARRL